MASESPTDSLSPCRLSRPGDDALKPTSSLSPVGDSESPPKPALGSHSPEATHRRMCTAASSGGMFDSAASSCSSAACSEGGSVAKTFAGSSLVRIEAEVDGPPRS